MIAYDIYHPVFRVPAKHTFRLELLDHYQDYYLLPPRLDLLSTSKIALEVVYDRNIYQLIYLLQVREVAPSCYVFLLAPPHKKEFPKTSALRAPKKLYLALSSPSHIGWEDINSKTEKKLNNDASS